MSKESCAIGCFALVVVMSFVTGVSAFMGWVTMLVWNATIGTSGGPQLSFLAAWGVWFIVSALLSRIGMDSYRHRRD